MVGDGASGIESCGSKENCRWPGLLFEFPLCPTRTRHNCFDIPSYQVEFSDSAVAIRVKI